jgi:hypothetical protein
MARTTAFAAVVVASLTVATSAAGGTSLVAISRPSRSSAKLTYSSSDGIAGLVKGGGTSASAISVDLFVRQGGTTATFVIPTGTYGERAGWLRNDAARAQFVNRDAPAGPTSLSRTTFSVGRRVKATAKSLGDENPLALGAAPAGDLAIAYVVTNGAERLAHCTKFLPGRCTFTPLDGGTGWRLRCRDGVADPDCAARPVCGNGVHERGEWCDGGPACDQTCTHPLTGCCDYQGQCIAAPYFSLYGYFVQYCGSLLNTAANTALIRVRRRRSLRRRRDRSDAHVLSGDGRHLHGNHRDVARRALVGAPQLHRDRGLRFHADALQRDVHRGRDLHPTVAAERATHLASAASG